MIDVTSKTVRRLTQGDFTIGEFSWSPDGKEIAFDHRINGDNSNRGTANISVVQVTDGSVRTLVTQDGPDTNPIWSPDGKRIAFESAMAKQFFYYTNTRHRDCSGGGRHAGEHQHGVRRESVTGRVDAVGPFLHRGVPHLVVSLQHRSGDAGGEPASRQPRQWIGSGFSLTRDGRTTAFIASDATTFPEVYVAPVASMQPRKLTDSGAQVAALAGGAARGRLLEEPGRRGDRRRAPQAGRVPVRPEISSARRHPRRADRRLARRRRSAARRIYPIDLWVAQGALVLEPNYRGSAGYGEKFRALNVRNLGVGDAWDVLSGVDS